MQPQDQGPVAAICAGATAALEARPVPGCIGQQGVTFCGAKNIGKIWKNMEKYHN